MHVSSPACLCAPLFDGVLATGFDTMASKQPEVDVKAVIEFLAKNLPTTKVMQHDRLVGCFTGACAAGSCLCAWLMGRGQSAGHLHVWFVPPGSKMVSFLVKSQHKSLKAVTTKEQAEAVAEQVAEYTDPVCMYRVHVSPVRGRLHATPLDKSGFSTDKAAMYAWSYAGSQTFNHVLLALLLVAVIIICLFPVWPRWGKLGALIVCASLLIFLLVFIFGRLLLWWTTWMLGYEVWILPNVFDEAESYVVHAHSPCCSPCCPCPWP